MSDHTFQTLDVTHARRELAKLYEQVADNGGRVEIKRRGSRETCVIISKTELESLEKALEILSDTDEVRTLAHSISHLCAVEQ